MKHYIVRTKADDYGACLTELVCTTAENAAEYYSHREVDEEDVPALAKYLDIVLYD